MYIKLYLDYDLGIDFYPQFVKNADGCNASGNAELVFKHEFHQFHQNAVLAVEKVLKAAGGDLRFLEDLRHGRLMVSVFQKQPDTSLQNPLFRLKSVASYCQSITPCYTVWLVDQL